MTARSWSSFSWLRQPKRRSPGRAPPGAAPNVSPHHGCTGRAGQTIPLGRAPDWYGEIAPYRQDGCVGLATQAKPVDRTHPAARASQLKVTPTEEIPDTHHRE